MLRKRIQYFLFHVAAGLFCAFTGLAQAQVFEVATTADGGPGSLGKAMLDANAGAAHSTLAFATTEGAPIVFESRAPGLTGGGLSIGPNHFPGHSFRLLERTDVTALGGGNLQAFSEQSVFAALYQVSTPETTPDVVNDSRLLGATLLEVPVGDPGDISGTLSLMLEPGWYAIVLGSGRHGATAPLHAVSLINTGTGTTPQSRGPYTMNPSTNARVLQSATARFFVEGTPTAPVEPSPTEFLMETARPSAWWSQAFSPISTNFRATRFEVTRGTRVNEVGAWMNNGSGQVFAAIVTLSGPDANPLPVTHPDFAASVVGSTLIDVAGAVEEYTGDFGGLALAPGHYALIFGSGMFGASGSASMMGVTDQLVKPGHLIWAGTFWGELASTHFRMFLKGFVPELSVTPDPTEFGDVVVGSTAEVPVTITNLREDANLQTSGIGVGGPGFGLAPDVANCSSTTLGPEQSCQFMVRFNPSASGPAAGVLQVWSDGEPSPFEISVTGNGVVPVIEIDPEFFEFEAVIGNQDLQTLTLANPGDGNLDWMVIPAETGDCEAPSGVPWLSVSEESGVTPPAGENTLDVAADTAELPAGEYQAQLCIQSNDPDTPLLTVPVALKVIAPALSFDPPGLDFGTVELDTGGAVLLASLHNTGDADATGLDLVLAGAEDYSITGGDCAVVLPVGENCQVEVTFLPAVIGPAATILEAVGNESTAFAELELTGNGFVPISPNDNGILFVDQNVSGGNQSGDSWDNALPEFTPALEWADEVWNPVDGDLQIWVAEGSYRPTDDDTDREARFALVDGVAVYGGFAGTETSLDERDWAAHPTILTGEVGGTNVYNVLFASGVGPDTLVDGFTVTGGHATSTSGGIPALGGGIHLINSAPVLSNMIFTANRARSGGAAYLDQSIPLFVNVLFLDNQATSQGGGAVFNNVNSHAIYLNCTFYGNTAHNSLFETAAGGAMYNWNGSSPEIINSIFWANTADTGEDQIFGPSGDFGGFTNEARIAHSIIEGGMPENTIDNGNNLFDDPLFTDSAGGDFTLQRESPAVNSGDPDTDLALFSGGPDNPRDLAGNPRVFPGFDQIIDIGAYELQDDPPAPQLSFDPPSLDFGEVEIDTGGASLATTLHNTGDADATSLDLALAGAADYSITGGDCAVVLPVGENCQVEITFLPSTIGPFTATLEAIGDESTAFAELALSGTGIAAILEIDPALFSFNLITGQSDFQTLSLDNAGNIDLDWSIEADTSCGAGLGAPWLSAVPSSGITSPGITSPVEITADASGLPAGLYDGVLCIASNALGAPQVSVPVNLTVTAPALMFDPPALDFGSVEVDATSAPMTALLHNDGDADATDLEFLFPAEFSADTTDCGNILPVAGACEVSVTFTPTAIGAADGVLSVGSAEGTVAELDLTGNGFEIGTLEIDPDQLHFADVVITTTRNLEFGITNAGNPGAEPVEISAITLDSGGPAFAINSIDCPVGTLLPPGDSCLVEVSFTPTQVAAHEGAVRITASDDQQVTLTLSGTVLGDTVFGDRFEFEQP